MPNRNLPGREDKSAIHARRSSGGRGRGQGEGLVQLRQQARRSKEIRNHRLNQRDQARGVDRAKRRLPLQELTPLRLTASRAVRDAQR